MDYNSGLFSAGISATLITVVGALYKFIQSGNHRRCISTCCGRRLDASFDIQETTPPPPRNQNPPTKASVQLPQTSDTQEQSLSEAALTIRPPAVVIRTGAKPSKPSLPSSVEDRSSEE